jgi:TMEM175 potassium channel family protein
MARNPALIEGTSRVEAFSDGVIAIIVTLLIFEVRLPEVGPNATNAEMWAAFVSVAPKLASFAVSFVTIAIFWVNHHSFFSGITHTDWKLLWANNLLLFFLAIVPFTTAVLGDHLLQPVAIAAYALDLGLAGLAFTLMGWYVLFPGRLVDPGITDRARRMEVRRSIVGGFTYLLSVPLAFVAPPVALVLFVAIPIAFIVPGVLGRRNETGDAR